MTTKSLSKADAATYSLRCAIVVTDLNRQRSDAEPLTEISNLNQSASAEALIAPIWLYVEIIQTSDKTAAFQGISLRLARLI